VHHVATVTTWLAAVLGAGSLAYGLAGLRSRQDRSRTQSWGRLWMGVFVLVETVPRLAGWSAGTVLVLSVLASLPLLLAGRSLRRS
jgi:hypothetical protein